jgi:hypothetical protein
MSVDKLGLGRKMERLVMDRWESFGYTTWQPPRAQYRKKHDGGTDIFGLWDFIAVKDEHPVHLVQVKRNRAEELETAFHAMSAFMRVHRCPVMPFVVGWSRERHTGRIRFEARGFGLTGRFFSDEWTAEPLPYPFSMPLRLSDTP